MRITQWFDGVPGIANEQKSGFGLSRIHARGLGARFWEGSTPVVTNRLSVNKRAAGRLEGFATYDPHVLLDPPPEDENPASRAIGLVIEASSGESHRYAISDRHGRFVFDGIAPGDYTVSAWAPGYPDTLKLLTSPSEIPIGPKSCYNKILLIQRRWAERFREIQARRGLV
jgi:hypothetical protein